MEQRERLSELNALLEELDAAANGEELEELAAELEDAIFLLECAEDEEEAGEALEEIAGLAEDMRRLGKGDPELTALAAKLERLLD